MRWSVGCSHGGDRGEAWDTRSTILPGPRAARRADPTGLHGKTPGSQGAEGRSRESSGPGLCWGCRRQDRAGQGEQPSTGQFGEPSGLQSKGWSPVSWCRALGWFRRRTIACWGARARQRGPGSRTGGSVHRASSGPRPFVLSKNELASPQLERFSAMSKHHTIFKNTYIVYMNN
ncbi:hypothetical protein HJG60_008062 [Phyllostomus discolor]|uniref:Uncharacterized protein n=1 Tax=Phyllostomus discolor TaxID=89673 RepID=A0A834BJ03_9CHIR|nr:hypothetical protein HJG60_008062 [Phyllostomus discolor]